MKVLPLCSISKGLSMETPLVSIIIPVYGIEKYIGQCVESISTVDFDYVLLASMERPLTEEATRQMESLGISEEKILSINETGDHHSQVLHYLYD